MGGEDDIVGCCVAGAGMWGWETGDDVTALRKIKIRVSGGVGGNGIRTINFA